MHPRAYLIDKNGKKFRPATNDEFRRAMAVPNRRVSVGGVIYTVCTPTLVPVPTPSNNG